MKMYLGRRVTKRLGTVAALVAAASLGSAVTVFASDKFSDVPDSHVFHDEIGWLADTGVTQGFLDGTFKPNQSVNRGQMAAFLQRFYNIFGGLETVASGTSANGPSQTNTWEDLDEAHVQVTVPPGTRGRIVVRFTGNVYCNSGDNIVAVLIAARPRCEMRFILGGFPPVEMKPGPMTLAESIDAASNGDLIIDRVSGTTVGWWDVLLPAGTYHITPQVRAVDSDGNTDDPLAMALGAWQIEARVLLEDAA